MNTDFLIRRPESNKTLGIEVEALVQGYQYVDTSTYLGFWYVTSDMSINGPGYGREFVSQPLTADHLKREIRKLHKKYDSMQFNESTGVHIHASKKWVGTKKAAKIWAFIQTLSDNDALELFGRRSNRYTLIHPAGIGGRNQRYHAINTTNDKTVEFRMFKSGGANWCQYCVDMVVYLIENANHLNIDAIYAFRDLTARKYSL